MYSKMPDRLTSDGLPEMIIETGKQKRPERSKSKNDFFVLSLSIFFYQCSSVDMSFDYEVQVDYLYNYSFQTWCTGRSVCFKKS